MEDEQGLFDIDRKTLQGMYENQQLLNSEVRYTTGEAKVELPDLSSNDLVQLENLNDGHEKNYLSCQAMLLRLQVPLPRLS